MPQPVVKRASEPQVVQWIWGAISAIRSQKQVANEDRILRHISREHGEEASQAASKQIHLAVDDGLIIEYRAPVQKAGAMFGAEQDAYRLPEDDIINGDHDWYCFECHHPGEVLECSSCWRVFHPNCIRSSINSEFTCPVCTDTEKPSTIKPKELNQMLSFTVLRLKEKSTALHWFGGAELGLDRFVHHYLDLNIIQTRTHDRYYTSLEQLFGDVCTIRHNIFVCFGENGVLQDMARVMLRDCQYDLDEIRQCRDCYLHSNIKNKDWFCQPCRVPHELVFAKQKGFGYWPAKVIKVSEDGYDVRFFGARHQRAMIPSGNVRPADTDLHALGVKRTAGFVRACNEMARHQELVQQVALKGFDRFSSMHYDSNDVRCKSANDSDDAIDQNGSKVSTASDRDDDDDDDDDDLIPTAVPRRRAPKKPRRSSQVRRRRTSSSSKTSHSKTRCFVEEPSVVSSSEDRNRNVKPVTCTDACVQTIKMLPMAGECVTVNHGTQTDNDSSSACTADCEARFEVKFRDLRARVEHELNEQMQVATKKLEERLRKEFEEDQQKAVQRALSNSARSTELVRLQTEKDCREQFDEEMKRVLQKQAADISTVKKKQWCYNCESEAMYHCCWNTSYCSIKCQQEHWHREHKRVCRRKRP